MRPLLLIACAFFMTGCWDKIDHRAERKVNFHAKGKATKDALRKLGKAPKEATPAKKATPAKQ